MVVIKGDFSQTNAHKREAPPCGIIEAPLEPKPELAGVTGGFKTMHSLRHTAITNAITHGRETLDVMAMARHKDMNTTLIYYHESDRLENPAEDSIDYGFDPTVELSHE